MKPLSANQIAVLLPCTLLVHQLEEYHTHFPLWFSNLLGAQLSDQDFIMINGVGLALITLLSLSYFFNRKDFILVALGTLTFANGIVHILASLFILSYSPGTVSGVFLFLPLGFTIYKHLVPRLRKSERVLAIATGIVALISVSLLAMNI